MLSVLQDYLLETEVIYHTLSGIFACFKKFCNQSNPLGIFTSVYGSNFQIPVIKLFNVNCKLILQLRVY